MSLHSAGEPTEICMSGRGEGPAEVRPETEPLQTDPPRGAVCPLPRAGQGRLALGGNLERARGPRRRRTPRGASFSRSDALARGAATCDLPRLLVDFDVPRTLPRIKICCIASRHRRAQTTAVQIVDPFGLDVCSGVRSSGALDPTLLHGFFAAAGY